MTRAARFDVFPSYSSDDRDAVIVPFLQTAKARRINTWCDFHEITCGDCICAGTRTALRRQ